MKFSLYLIIIFITIIIIIAVVVCHHLSHGLLFDA